MIQIATDFAKADTADQAGLIFDNEPDRVLSGLDLQSSRYDTRSIRIPVSLKCDSSRRDTTLRPEDVPSDQEENALISFNISGRGNQRRAGCPIMSDSCIGKDRR